PQHVRPGRFPTPPAVRIVQASLRPLVEPYLEGQNIMYMSHDPRSGMLLAAVGDPWFGSRVYRSRDLGRTWDEPQSGPAFPPESGLKLEKIWNVTPGRPDEPGVLYAGVEPAALFKSTDEGETWQFIESLN